MELTSQQALHMWHQVVTQSLVAFDIDLSARQMAVMLTVYLSQQSHGVKTLSSALNISKPAVCRAIDCLASNGLVKRKRDEEDRRNVTVQRTIKGSVFLTELGEMISVHARRLGTAKPVSPISELSAA